MGLLDYMISGADMLAGLKPWGKPAWLYDAQDCRYWTRRRKIKHARRQRRSATVTKKCAVAMVGVLMEKSPMFRVMARLHNEIAKPILIIDDSFRERAMNRIEVVDLPLRAPIDIKIV